MARKKVPLLAKLFVWLLLLAIIFGIAGFAYWNHLKSPVDPLAETKAFVIPKGATIDEIATKLEEEGFIRSAFVFKTLIKLSGNSHVEAGDFKISAAMTPEEILKSFGQGATDIWVTLIEGQRLEQMAITIEKELGISQADFLAAAKGKEGYLFPDTYLINKNADAETVVSILENTFNKKYSEDLQNKIKAQGLSPKEGVILASLVEQEARSEKVRTEVAGIMLKRLNMGMKLDIDATVRYALDSELIKSGKKPEKFWQPILRSDYTDTKSPYNTYLNAGLPPAPISSVSRTSLTAVANADPDTPYLFYFHNSKGETFYGRTLDEHNQNVANHR